MKGVDAVIAKIDYHAIYIPFLKTPREIRRNFRRGTERLLHPSVHCLQCEPETLDLKCDAVPLYLLMEKLLVVQVRCEN